MIIERYSSDTQLVQKVRILRLREELSAHRGERVLGHWITNQVKLRA
jgi:hypothetical protein